LAASSAGTVFRIDLPSQEALIGRLLNRTSTNVKKRLTDLFTHAM
jgi:hypothetical protein